MLEFRWMTDRKTLSNTSIKLMWSKCDTDRDGYLDFEEFREMILRARARKELKTLEEEGDMMELDQEEDVKSKYKAAQAEVSHENSDEDIEENIIVTEDVLIEPPLEDDISEEIDFEEELSAKVKVKKNYFHF